MPQKPSIMTDFKSTGLHADLLKAIEALGFVEATPVQSEVIPRVLNSNRDLIALAQTGTGKTAAFGLPVLQHIDPDKPDTQAIILCPTRELCLQISRDLEAFAKHRKGIRSIAVYGGAPIGPQLKALSRGVHVIIATPGRMNDVLRRGKAKLSPVQFVVLDEADEMLDMGFQEDLETILAETPDKARTLLFSATMPRQMERMAGRYMTDPETITVGDRNSGSHDVEHEFCIIQARDRYAALKRLVDYHPDIYGIIFCRTRLETQQIAAKLMKEDYNADALHGDLSQAQRDRVMENFRMKNLQVLVATDVAARGLDVQDLTHVINYNLPDDLDVYTHRSGRTGRAGRQGTSITLVHGRETNKLRYIERMIKRPFKQISVPGGQDIVERQMVHLADRLTGVEVKEGQIERYLTAFTDKLAEVPREELIARIASLEFNRLLEFYRKAPDLNVKGRMDSRDSKGDRKQRDRGERRSSASGDSVTISINAGKRNGMSAQDMITLINRSSRGKRLDIGRIDIGTQFTTVEIPASEADRLTHVLDKAAYKGRALHARVVDGQDAPPDGRRFTRHNHHRMQQKRKGRNPRKRR